MRTWLADRLELWAARLLTWSNDVRLGDYRRRRQQQLGGPRGVA